MGSLPLHTGSSRDVSILGQEASQLSCLDSGEYRRQGWGYHTLHSPTQILSPLAKVVASSEFPGELCLGPAWQQKS